MRNRSWLAIERRRHGAGAGVWLLPPGGSLLWDYVTLPSLLLFIAQEINVLLQLFLFLHLKEFGIHAD